MTHRVISGLVSASECAVPHSAWDKAKKAAKGSRAKGHGFERTVGRYFRDKGWGVKEGQWFSFLDRAGPGHAQPDYIVELPGHLLLVEAKLTQTETAFLQMSQLYVPILEHVYKLPVITLQACRGLRYTPHALRTPEELWAQPEFGNFTWHYLGRGF